MTGTNVSRKGITCSSTGKWCESEEGILPLMTLSSQILLKEGLINQKSFSTIVEQSSYKQFHYITPLAK